jgi:hypothetical protein
MKGYTLDRLRLKKEPFRPPAYARPFIREMLKFIVRTKNEGSCHPTYHILTSIWLSTFLQIATTSANSCSRNQKLLPFRV